MSNSPAETPQSADETPKTVIAKKVIAQKRLYFIPDQSVSVEAESVDDAVTKAQKLNIAKDGDA